MSSIDKYTTHHKELLAIAGEISSKFDPEELAKDASEVRNLLATLSGKLKVHLAMEDKALYPRLLEHADTRIKETAQKFQNEMGDISKALNEYLEKWPNFLKIQNDPNGFISETKSIFDALGKRIESEDNILYPMASELIKTK